MLQERSELLAVQKNEVEGLLARRSSLEREFMEQYLAACEQYEQELEAIRTAGVVEHAALRRRLEAEVAGLELHLDGLKATHGLNADKLGYNYAVLGVRRVCVCVVRSVRCSEGQLGFALASRLAVNPAMIESGT